MDNNIGKYNFIRIEKVIIRNFSLYKRDGAIIEINEDITKGVYCLAGANGLGKTTFLNIVNYGLTGIVLVPNKEVFSPNEIVKFNKDYTSRYFEGRISSKDKNLAEVELHFFIKNIRFKIIRGFNNREELRLFEVYIIDNKKKNSIINTQKLSPVELNDHYQKTVTNEIGIGRFEYFIFFQLYILTFDENRRMLFWDDRAMTSVLSIAFNYDLSTTEKTLDLKRKMEKHESAGRNARWQATQIKNKIESILSNRKNEDSNSIEIKHQFDEIAQRVNEDKKTLENVKIEYDTLLKRQNIVNSEILHLKTEYKKLFSQYSEPRSKLLNNKYIIYSKKENKCFLCSSHGHYVVQNIEKNLFKNECPVCNTSIIDQNHSNQDNLLDQLGFLDKTIALKAEDLDNIIYDTEAKKVTLEKSEFDYEASKNKLKKFEKENSTINFNISQSISINELINDYKKQFEKFDKDAQDYYSQRDKIRPEYDNLISKINSSYIETEQYFVPLFKKFSKSFIGLDLNIFFKKKGKDISLNFELQGTARPEAFQLSESQRFFLDIALRMAFAVHLSTNWNGATLLIDTPEGSLDIAYEGRVGNMFANFVVEHDQNIIMTSNINASQLLISLAGKCKEKKMKFRRMLDWTDLSEIQKEGEHLFEEVYNNIQYRLMSES